MKKVDILNTIEKHYQAIKETLHSAKVLAEKYPDDEIIKRNYYETLQVWYELFTLRQEIYK